MWKCFHFWWIFWIFFVGFATGIAQVSESGQGVYPYAYIQDVKPPFYTKFRAEGASAFTVAMYFMHYSLKYKFKKHDFSTAERLYFQNQQAIFRHIENKKALSLSEASLKIGFAGDIMWIRNNWNDFLDPGLLRKMQEFDFLIGNLESPIAGHKKVRSFLTDYLKFNADPGLITSFRHPDGRPLFKALSFANNHTLDTGDDGALATLQLLDSLGIRHSGVSAGANDSLYKTFVEKGIKFGFYAACWGLNSYLPAVKTELKINIVPGISPIGSPLPDLSEIYFVLEQMQQDSVDFKIISLHWGAEYEMLPHPVQVIIARKITASGADLILGHHPHVVQPFEIIFFNGYEDQYRDDAVMMEFIRQNQAVRLADVLGRPRKALVLYSMGNFVSRMWTRECRESQILGLHVFRAKDNSVDWEISERVGVVNYIQRSGLKAKHRLILLTALKYE